MGNKVNRRVTYKLYSSRAQMAALERLHHLHRVLYNAALEERIEAYRMARISISYANQCKSLTAIRQQDPAYLAVNAQSAQVTLKRLDLAFKAFFRGVEAGEEPGFPRFKGKDRFPGFGFKTHGDGFRFTPGKDWRHGKPSPRLPMPPASMPKTRMTVRSPRSRRRSRLRAAPSPKRCAVGAPSAPPRRRKSSRDGIAALPTAARTATTKSQRASCVPTS